MAQGWTGRLRSVALVALGLSAAWAGEAMAKTYTLSISGEGTRYRGACALMLASGEERIELEGAAPLQRTFEGEGLACRLEAEGALVIEIAHDGSRSHAATSGGTIQISAR